MAKTTRLAFCLLIMTNSHGFAQQVETRGELLYSIHCIECHTTQIHWRDRKLARNWNSLNSEVRRWTESADLDWSEDDRLAVARYLNTLYYHFPPLE